MIFEYGVYFRDLMFGVAFLVFSSLLILCDIIMYVRKRNIRDFIIGIAISIFCFINAVVPFKHGIHLTYEKENDKIEAVGEVTKIEKIYGISKYVYNDQNSFPCYVFIDGEEYYIMHIGNLELGDVVKIEYLPNSKIILSIDEIETNKFYGG